MVGIAVLALVTGNTQTASQVSTTLGGYILLGIFFVSCLTTTVGLEPVATQRFAAGCVGGRVLSRSGSLRAKDGYRSIHHSVTLS